MTTKKFLRYWMRVTDFAGCVVSLAEGVDVEGTPLRSVSQSLKNTPTTPCLSPQTSGVEGFRDLGPDPNIGQTSGPSLPTLPTIEGGEGHV